MKREQQIEKAALDYCGYGTETIYSHIENAFIAGAEWADANPCWVSVEEALPECNIQEMETIKMSRVCMVLLKNGTTRIATLNQNYDEGKASGEPYWFDEILTSDGCWLNQLVTHWFALPKVEERR